jgi:hypothetical protein
MSVTIMLITVTTIPMTLTVIPVINYVPFIIFPICITSVNTGSSQNVKHFGERRTATRLSNAHIYSITCKSNKSTKKQTFVLGACYQNKISQAGE